MPALADGLRFPHARVLLPRTRLAYVHLANLLSDAKRDRAAKVFGYVAIWLEKDLVLLYLQDGQVINATATSDGKRWTTLSIADAIGRVPAKPEYGAICFHEAADELLACVFHAQTTEPLPWPPEIKAGEARALFPFLMSNLFDGLLEVAIGGELNYLLVRDGTVKRAYLSSPARDEGVGLQMLSLFEPSALKGELPEVRRWGVPPALPVQAPPALIAAYRELMRSLVDRLQADGTSAAAIAEHARLQLVAAHPVLAHFSMDGRDVRDPVVAPQPLSLAMAAWTSELLWTAGTSDSSPERVLYELGRDRRHLFQSAGYWDALPWRITW